MDQSVSQSFLYDDDYSRSLIEAESETPEHKKKIKILITKKNLSNIYNVDYYSGEFYRPKFTYAENYEDLEGLKKVFPSMANLDNEEIPILSNSKFFIIR